MSFRTAFIVGYPGETDEAFEELRDFVADTGFDRVAAFLYSDEEGTAAVEHDGKVPRSAMEERRNELLALQDDIAASKGRERIGHTLEVLIDGASEESADLLEARHEGLGPEIDGVVYIGKESGRPGDFVKVLVNDAVGYDLVAVRNKSEGPIEPSLLHPSKTNRGYR